MAGPFRFIISAGSWNNKMITITLIASRASIGKVLGRAVDQRARRSCHRRVERLSGVKVERALVARKQQKEVKEER